MAQVFISHTSKDNYFVDFLVALLRFHHVDVWVDRRNLEAGGIFTTDIEHALATCDSMLVVVSQNAVGSRWITREISAFKAANADRPVIPIVLDREADLNEIYEGLGLVTQLRCYDSFLESFRELLQMQNRTLFPAIENRKVPDRRSEDRRRSAAERRKSPVDQRLRVAISQGYAKLADDGVGTSLGRASDVEHLARFLASNDSPLQSFEFVNRINGEERQPDFGTIEDMALLSWQEQPNRKAAYIIDGIIDELMRVYIVTPHDRRSAERRGQKPRRRRET
jgi:TIR domain